MALDIKKILEFVIVIYSMFSVSAHSGRIIYKLAANFLSVLQNVSNAPIILIHFLASHLTSAVQSGLVSFKQ